MPDRARRRRTATSASTRSAPGPYRFVRYAVDDRVELDAVRRLLRRRAAERGLVLKVVPDDIMRGLELRKGHDRHRRQRPLARHRPSARARAISCRRSTAPGVDYQYIGVNLRDPVAERRARAPGARATPSTGRRSSSTCAAAWRRRPTGCCRRSSWAYEPDVLDVHARSRARAARCSTRPAIPIPTATARRRGSD